MLLLKSERVEKLDQCVAVGCAHAAELLTRCLALAAMPHYGLGEIARTTIVKIVAVAVDLFLKSDAP